METRLTGPRLGEANGPVSVTPNRYRRSEARGLLLTRWAFSGSGTVTNPAGLDAAMREGIGRGRAFGCGMLLGED